MQSEVLFQILGRIHAFPPCGIVLQVFGKPRIIGVDPLLLFAVIQNMMILSLYSHEGAFASQNLQGIEHLRALYDGHIRVGSSM